jgi:hypothetical protein
LENDDDKSLCGAAFTAIESAALESDPSVDSDTPRDVWWLRWLKLFSIVAVPAIVLGFGFLFEDYVSDHRTENIYEQAVPANIREQEVVSRMKFRFWLGASVGGGLGLIYVARCIVRKADP